MTKRNHELGYTNCLCCDKKKAEIWYDTDILLCPDCNECEMKFIHKKKDV